MDQVTLESVLRDVYENYCTTDSTKLGGPLLLEVAVLANDYGVSFTIDGKVFAVVGDTASTVQPP